ncbi:hypothetical protein ACTNDY_10590 [Tissierellaceae bacterium HCP3S3_D8]
MIKKFLTISILFIVLLNLQVIRAEEYQYIEIFDPKQDKVIKVIKTDKEINNMVADWIDQIDGIYTKINPIEDDGYAIRFPLDPAIQVENKWLNTIVEELYLIVPEKNPPFFIIFETENKPVCFLFTGDISKLSDVLEFNLK